MEIFFLNKGNELKYLKYIMTVIVLNIGFLYSSSEINILSDTVKLKKMQDDTLKVNLIIKISEQLKDYNGERGLAYAKNGLEISKKIHYQFGEAISYKAMGVNYWKTAKYDIALKNYLKAEYIFKKINQKYHLCRTYNNIGLVFYARNDFNKALTYFGKGLSIAQKINNTVELARLNHNTALVEYEKGNKLKALNYHKKSYNYSKLNQDISLMAYNKCFMGKCYTFLKQYESAETSLKESILLFNQLGLPDPIAMVYNQYAFYLNSVGQFQLSLEFSQKAMKIGKEVVNPYMQLEAIGFIASSYEGLKDYKNALYFQKKYHDLHDKLLNERNLQSFGFVEAKYNSKIEIDSIKTAKQSEVYKSKMIARTAIITAVLLLIISIVIFAFYKLKVKVNVLLSNKNTQISALNSTKDKFFSIIAHDLRNPLAGFKGITELLHSNYNQLNSEQKFELITTMKTLSIQLYQLLENLLEWSRSQRGKIILNLQKTEINSIIENTIGILNANINAKQLNVINAVPNNFFLLVDENLFMTIMRNLISNAVKFSNIGGEITIGISKNPNSDLIDIYVKDNGVGISEENIVNLFKIDRHYMTEGTAGEKGTGLGLILCEEFAKMHGGHITIKSVLDEGSIFGFSVKQENTNAINN